MRREKQAAGFTFSEHSEKSAEEPSVNNSSAIGVVENEDRSTLIDDKESKVNFNQECGLLVKNTEEVLIKDESLAVEASDSNLVIHPVNETLEYQNIDGNSTAVTLKEDVKIVDDLGSEEHDIVSTDVEGSSIVNVHATAVIESSPFTQFSQEEWGSLLRCLACKDHLTRNIEDVKLCSSSTQKCASNTFKHEVKILILVRKESLWESPRSYIWRHLGQDCWTRGNGSTISLTKIHQK